MITFACASPFAVRIWPLAHGDLDDIAQRRCVAEHLVQDTDAFAAIFDFYTPDFLAHAPSLIAYINRYRAAQVPADFKVRFLEHHWTVNHRKWAYLR
jgi:hypothetical protein